MKDLSGKAAAKVSQEEVFQALSYAALKARAGRIAPNQILRVGNFELIVAHDEEGVGLVVQMILPLADLQAMALAWAGELDGSVEAWSDGERRSWLESFFSELARYLSRWQSVVMRRGPGENVTLEKAVSP
jgi:hypothetical protein